MSVLLGNNAVGTSVTTGLYAAVGSSGDAEKALAMTPLPRPTLVTMNAAMAPFTALVCAVVSDDGVVVQVTYKRFAVARSKNTV